MRSPIPTANVVSGSPFAHGPVEDAIAAAGLALFVEKPLALDCAIAERVAARLSAAGVVTAVGHHWRYSNAVRRAQALLAGRQVRLATGAWLARSLRSTGGRSGAVAEVRSWNRPCMCSISRGYSWKRWHHPTGSDVDGVTAVASRFAGGAVGTLATTCRLTWKQRAGLDI